MATPEQWIKVAEIVNRLRGSRPKREIVKNPNTLRRMENGLPVHPATLRGIESALNLPPGALDHALDTGELPPEPQEEVRHAFESPGEVFDGIAGCTEEERAEIVALLERGLARVRADRARRAARDQ